VLYDYKRFGKAVFPKKQSTETKRKVHDMKTLVRIIMALVAIFAIAACETTVTTDRNGRQTTTTRPSQLAVDMAGAVAEGAVQGALTPRYYRGYHPGYYPGYFPRYSPGYLIPRIYTPFVAPYCY